MSLIELPIYAERACDAISKIGYTPESALMDIVDNSVAAGASHVEIAVNVKDGFTLVMKDAVESYRVSDNGIGMDDSEIASAFSIGTPRNYPKNSLSKYGLGLKSAGLSLGERITVISKKNGVLSSCNVLDRELIKEHQKYVINRRSLSADEVKLADKLLPGNSGTIVTIERTDKSNQRSPKTIQQNLLNRLGVTYNEFIIDQKNPLHLTLVTGPKSEKVEGKDILFLDTSKGDFDTDSYDCVSPYKVFDEQVSVTEGDEIPPFRLVVSIFPQDSMAGYPELTDAQQQQIKDYDISAANRGFFILRNHRLIQWGEDLGIVGKDDRNFRARLYLTTEHDNIFHVDVSKQRLEISEDILEKIKRICQMPLRQAREAASACQSKLKISAPGRAFNERNVDLAAEDVEKTAPTDPESAAEIKSRTKKLVQKSEQLEKEEPPKEKGEQDRKRAFEKVRYSDQVSTFKLWEAGFDPHEGDWVRLNRNHAFFSTVLRNLPESSPVRQAMEAVFWALAAAENNTKKKHLHLTVEDVDRLYVENQKRFAVYLDEWSSANMDLADEL